MSLRLFVGLPLPHAVQQMLAEVAEELAPLFAEHRVAPRFTKPGNGHLTLKFLGETDDALLPELKKALARVSFAPFSLAPTGAGTFPDLALAGKNGRPPMPKVLWVGVSPDQGGLAAGALAARLGDALTGMGIPREAKPFRPHLTLARLGYPRLGKKGKGPRELEKLWGAVLKHMAAKVWPTFSVETMVLYKSELGAGGPLYEELGIYTARCA